MIQQEQIKDYFSNNWKDVVDKMREGLMLVDLKGNILYANAALEELLHFSNEELIGKPCKVIECDNCFDHKISKNGKHCALFSKGEILDLHCSFKRKDGSMVQVLKNATVLTDKYGEVVAGVETFTDLTAIKDNEEVIVNLRKELNRENNFHGLIGTSAIMQQVYDLIKNAAQSNAPIIIYGESGTGKEIVANAIHKLSKQSDRPFIKINCAALSDTILESELLGRTQNSYTGTGHNRTGRLESADSGSVFLDEIGDLPISMQSKLLQVLKKQEVERDGDHHPPPFDVRIISTTNKNLNTLMAQEKFREDLFYRIGVLPINIPPLRHHPEDIPLLVKTFIDRSNLKTEEEITTIRKDALDLLVSYHWPGNIRELINVIEYTFVLCPEGEITPGHLPRQFQTHSSSRIGQTPNRISSPKDKRQQLLHVLDETKGNKTEAAKILGISRVTLWKHLKNNNITVDKSAY